MKKQNILISLLAIFALVGCTNNNAPSSKASQQQGGTSQQQGGDDIPTFKIEGFKTAKFEAEDFNVDNWEPDVCYDGDTIIDEDKASGGSYLAAADPNYGGAYAEFNFEITAYSHVVFSAAYAQTAENISKVLEMDKIYTYEIENISSLRFESGKNTLKARSSATTWEGKADGTESMSKEAEDNQ